MSHWTKTQLRSLTNEEALKRAWIALGGQVLTCNAKGYYTSTIPCDLCLRHKDSPYDIAVKRASVGLWLETDWYQGHVERVAGKEYSKLLEYYQSELVGQVAEAEGQQWWRVASTEDAQRINENLGLWGDEALTYNGKLMTVILK